MDLDIEDSGRLRESAFLQIATLREIKSHQLPTGTAAWWQKLHRTLNDPVSTQALSKEAVDEDDQQTLLALGILQVWVYFAGQT